MSGIASDEPHGAFLHLAHLEVEGFKSFRDRCMIGPLYDFTCVVGPNGGGKSVVHPGRTKQHAADHTKQLAQMQGEAIAFALGGNRKMLRTGSLAGLLNQELAAAGHRDAEVILHMEVCQSKSNTTAPGAAPGTPLHSTSHASLSVGTLSPDTSHTKQQHQHTPPQEAMPDQQACPSEQKLQPVQQLKLKRVLRGDATRSYMMRPGSNSWAAVSQVQLQAELAPYGIDTRVVDRYIVTQSRQAVDVSDAVGLVKQLEGLTGAVDYEEVLAQHSTGLEQLAASIEDTKARIDRLADQRELLAPAVEHWQHVQQVEADVNATKFNLLLEQQQHGSRLLQLQSHKVQVGEGAAAAAKDVLASAVDRESDLHQQRSVLEQEQQAAKRREEQLVKKVGKLSAAAAAAEVQHTSAASALKENKALLKALQKKAAQHDKQEGQHKALVEQGTQQLRALQDAVAEAQQHLESARTAAATAVAQQRSSAQHGKRVGVQAAEEARVREQQQVLQQQLAEVQCELRLLAARQAAAAAKVTRAAKSVGTLQHKVDTAADATAEGDRALAAAEQELQQATEALAVGRLKSTAAEEAWRQAELQQQAVSDQLPEMQQGQQHNHPQHTSTPQGTVPLYDAAVQHLAAASTAGQLPGHFYGRLCNLVCVTDPSAHQSVNAALQERCNLGTMLVVSDRATAAAVVEHFRHNRIGTVSCKILLELQQQRQATHQHNTAAAAAAAAGNAAVRPLLGLLQYDSQGIPGLQQLMEQLLGGWLLVETREAALQMLHLKSSMVTRSGEVFKADGEIVASFGGASSSNRSNSNRLPAYSLSFGQPASLPAAPVAADPVQQKQDAGSSGAAKAAASREQELKRDLAAAQKQAGKAQHNLESARMALLHQEQQLASSHGKLRWLQQQQQQAGQARANSSSSERLQQLLQDAMQQKSAADQELSAATAAVEAATKHQEQLLRAIADAAQAAASAGGSSSSGGAAAADNPAVSGLKQAEQEAKAAAAALDAAWQGVHKAEKQQKQAASRAAATRKEVAKVQAAVDAADMDKSQTKLDALQQQLAATQSELQEVRGDASSIRSRLKPLMRQLLEAGAAKNRATAALEDAQADVQRAKQSLQQLQQQQDARAASLQQLRNKLTSSSTADVDPSEAVPLLAAGQEGCKRARVLGNSHGVAGSLEAGQQQQDKQQQDEEMQDADLVADDQATDPTAASSADDAAVGGEGVKVSRERAKAGRKHSRRHAAAASKQGRVGGSLRRTTCRTVIIDSSSSSSSSDEGASDADDEGSSSGCSDAEEDTAAAGHAGTRGAAAAAATSKLPSAAALAKQAAALDLKQQQLDEQEQYLQEQYALVDRSALEQDLLALQGLAAAHSTLQQLLSQHEAAATALEQLIDERYSRLLSVLQSLNAKLDPVYNQLTGGCGKAYCAYTAERRLLFSQGVTLHLQPDSNTWRRLGMLSGGQRSLATLALSFALQTLFPSPFYFFDEVDCALDTSAAARVAAYVRQQCSGPSAAQYLLVSHKPVVFESAGCLLGVYSNGRGSSAAVVGHFA